MKAARFYGKEDLRIEEVPEPSPGPGQVKLRNAFAGICGSDLHFFFYPESLPFSLDEPHPLSGATLPQILGHEFSGTALPLPPWRQHTTHIRSPASTAPTQPTKAP
ncbi:alcohol dehydrogenase catalytic domain-containing protein [Streptomyces sp. NPDC048106]|uniref:alcohol dehydrogenase catalytic domain-containing protein n=1 Tax=Streptomyces sp. NPDC048106 TaxID=3155750 RepID=UPI0034537083